MSTVIICGSRSWRDWLPIIRLVDSLPPDTVVIDGHAAGADNIAHLCAKKRGLTTRRYPAKWSLHGRRAGPIRNAEMLKEEKPTHVYAFAYDLENSKGTRNMVERARAAGVAVEVWL